MIEIKKITKKFGEKKVLNDVSFNIYKNEPVFLIGKSGIGKTTLVNIILGFEKADSGEINGLENLKKAVVFQEDRLCENISPIKNLKIACPNVSENIIESAFIKVGFSKDDLYKPVKNLSGGMKRRTALLRCILYDGDFIIMDEPFKGLDEETKTLCIDFLKENIFNKYVLIITHNENDSIQINGKLIKF